MNKKRMLEFQRSLKKAKLVEERRQEGLATQGAYGNLTGQSTSHMEGTPDRGTYSIGNRTQGRSLSTNRSIVAMEGEQYRISSKMEAFESKMRRASELKN